VAETPSEKKINVRLVVFFALVIAWIAFALPIWPMSVILILVVGIFLAFRSARASAAVLLLSPLVVVPLWSLGLGVWGYWTGTGYIRSYGLPGRHYHNLDPQLRCYKASKGCVIDGSEFLTQTPNNLALQSLITVFGPMRGHYAGPYPTPVQALGALEKSRPTFLPGELKERSAGLGLPAGEALDQLSREIGHTLEKDLPIAAAEFEGETIVLGREKCLFLVERRTSRCYARYYFGCNTWELQINGKWDQAIQELTHAVAVDPLNPEYWKERAKAHAGKGDRDRAIADYRQCLEVAPRRWYDRDEVEAELKRLESSGR
jgi:hypothetical protein